MSNNGNTPINLVLPLDAVNMVLGALGTQPYERVVGLVTSIQQQAVAQLQPAAVATKTEALPEPEEEGT